MVCSPSSSSARRERPGRSQRLPTAPPASAVAAGFADSSRTSAVLTANTPLTKTETIRLAMTGYHPASPVTWPIPMNCPAKPTRATNSSGAPRPRGARSPPDDNQIAGRLAHNSAQRQRGWSLAEQRDAEHGRKCQRPDVADRCHHAHRPAPHRPVPEGHADPSAQAGESTPPHGRRGGGSGRGEKKQQADQRSTDLRVSRHDDARLAREPPRRCPSGGATPGRSRSGSHRSKAPSSTPGAPPPADLRSLPGAIRPRSAAPSKFASRVSCPP